MIFVLSESRSLDGTLAFESAIAAIKFMLDHPAKYALYAVDATLDDTYMDNGVRRLRGSHLILGRAHDG